MRLKGELVHKLAYDDPGYRSRPSYFRRRLCGKLRNELAIRKLRKIINAATPKPLGVLEAPELDD